MLLHHLPIHMSIYFFLIVYITSLWQFGHLGKPLAHRNQPLSCQSPHVTSLCKQGSKTWHFRTSQLQQQNGLPPSTLQLYLHHFHHNLILVCHSYYINNHQPCKVPSKQVIICDICWAHLQKAHNHHWCTTYKSKEVFIEYKGVIWMADASNGMSLSTPFNCSTIIKSLVINITNFFKM